MSNKGDKYMLMTRPYLLPGFGSHHRFPPMPVRIVMDSQGQWRVDGVQQNGNINIQKYITMDDIASKGYTFTPLILLTPQLVDALERVMTHAEIGWNTLHVDAPEPPEFDTVRAALAGRVESS